MELQQPDVVESVWKYAFIYEGTIELFRRAIAVLPPIVYTLLVYLLVIFRINTVCVIIYLYTRVLQY